MESQNFDLWRFAIPGCHLSARLHTHQLTFVTVNTSVDFGALTCSSWGTVANDSWATVFDRTPGACRSTRPTPSRHQACRRSCWARISRQGLTICSPWSVGVVCLWACRGRCTAKAFPTHAPTPAAPGVNLAYSGGRVACWCGSSTCVHGPVRASPASPVGRLPGHTLHLSTQGQS